jgi:hypothetical protein
MFEIVYTHNWHDGPRDGIADFQGNPHLFESEWADREEDDDTFLLMPIERETFDLAIEDWAIWRRWETAFHQGKATKETHPALPEDHQRHEEIKRLLEDKLVIDRTKAIRMTAEFRVRDDPDWSGSGWCPLEVRWEVLS